MIFVILLLIILVFALDGIRLIRKKQWNELTVFSVLLGAALLLQILNKLGLPDPVNILNKVLSPIGRAILRQS